MESRMSSNKLAHIGYVVESLDLASKKFLQEGAKFIVEPIVDPVQNVEICILRLDHGEVDIELVAPRNKGNNPISGRLKRGGGLDHICFYTSNLTATLEFESKKGAILLSPPTYAVAFETNIAFVFRRSGLIVEFIEQSENCL